MIRQWGHVDTHQVGQTLPPPSTAANARHVPAFTHGFRSLRFEPPPEIQAKAQEVREQLSAEFPGIEALSLPTVELLCMAFARAYLYHQVIMEYACEVRSRTIGGVAGCTGIEACPAYIIQQADRATDSAAKIAQDLGLDLTGRVKALKDDAIRRSLTPAGGGVAALAGQGRQLRQLRQRGEIA